MSSATTTLWDAIKGELAAVLAPAVYQTRVAATSQATLNETSLIVRCPDAATGRWLEQRLGRMIAEIASGLMDDPPPVHFAVTT